VLVLPLRVPHPHRLAFVRIQGPAGVSESRYFLGLEAATGFQRPVSCAFLLLPFLTKPRLILSFRRSWISSFDKLQEQEISEDEDGYGNTIMTIAFVVSLYG
jgi:hypothetical protein